MRDVNRICAYGLIFSIAAFAYQLISFGSTASNSDGRLTSGCRCRSACFRYIAADSVTTPKTLLSHHGSNLPRAHEDRDGHIYISFAHRTIAGKSQVLIAHGDSKPEWRPIDTLRHHNTRRAWDIGAGLRLRTPGSDRSSTRSHLAVTGHLQAIPHRSDQHGTSGVVVLTNNYPCDIVLDSPRLSCRCFTVSISGGERIAPGAKLNVVVTPPSDSDLKKLSGFVDARAWIPAKTDGESNDSLLIPIRTIWYGA